MAEEQLRALIRQASNSDGALEKKVAPEKVV
jgi:hypothetical protein